jgi:hypothetical protein
MVKPELTYEEFCMLPMQYYQGIRYDWGAMRLHRNDAHGIQKETVTKQKKRGDIYSGWKDPDIVYFLDGDDREFKTTDQIYVAYMEKACGIK